MKTIVLEYFDVYGKKHCIKLPELAKEKILNYGLKIDASDVLGLIFVCDTEFTLRPVAHSVRQYENKEVYLCRVYDEQNRLLDNFKEFWMNKIQDEIKRLGDFFIDENMLKKRSVIIQPINVR